MRTTTTTTTTSSYTTINNRIHLNIPTLKPQHCLDLFLLLDDILTPKLRQRLVKVFDSQGILLPLGMNAGDAPQGPIPSITSQHE